ncbi:MAG: hypothetical protein ACRCVX_16575 [Shewanella sp.]
MIDTIQIILSQQGDFGKLICWALAWVFGWSLMALVFFMRKSKMLLFWLFGGTIKDAGSRAFASLGVGFMISQFSPMILDELAELERPVYVNQAQGVPVTDIDTKFESEIRKRNPPNVASVVINRSRSLAQRLNIPVNWIYQTALNECALNPFTVRTDKVAAGWIQFTRVGLSGIGSGESLQSVIQYCKEGKADTIMGLTDRYIMYHAKDRQLARPVDFYLAVFAPAHIGKDASAVLYQGYGTQAYELNKGLDGWIERNGRIIRKYSRCDGVITLGELALCQEKKTNDLLFK